MSSIGDCAMMLRCRRPDEAAKGEARNDENMAKPMDADRGDVYPRNGLRMGSVRGPA
jgi:hypothetical protein